MKKNIDYGEGIYNGDIGYIYHIDKHNKTIYVLFDEYKIFKYKYDELSELDHCFCTTVHKSQGSEFPMSCYTNDLGTTYVYWVEISCIQL